MRVLSSNQMLAVRLEFCMPSSLHGTDKVRWVAAEAGWAITCGGQTDVQLVNPSQPQGTRTGATTLVITPPGRIAPPSMLPPGINHWPCLLTSHPGLRLSPPRTEAARRRH
eukprot:scaffold283601_cov46-Tisochrysis_lutea.AAC.1